MALEGTLTDMPLADMLEIFQAHRRSGRLLLSRQDERGLIFFGDGRLIDALLVTDLDGEGVAHAEDAVVRLLNWREAEFVFEHDPTVIARPRRVIHDIDWFLAAVRKASAPSLSLSSRLQPASPPASTAGPLTLSVEEWRLLGALWPQRSLGMACVELELAPHEVLAQAQALVRRGLLRVSDDSDAPRAGPRAAEPAHQMMSVAPLKHIARSQPHPTGPSAAVQSHLLKAIIRKVRML